jgi:hypothetical protein
MKNNVNKFKGVSNIREPLEEAELDLSEILSEVLSSMSDEEFNEAWNKVKDFEDKGDKHIEYVFQIGDVNDCNAFGGTVVTEEIRQRDIERIKRHWLEVINCQLMLYPEMKFNEQHIPIVEYVKKPNKYYGWKKEQLEIIERGTNKRVKFRW